MNLEIIIGVLVFLVLVLMVCLVNVAYSKALLEDDVKFTDERNAYLSKRLYSIEELLKTDLNFEVRMKDNPGYYLVKIKKN